MAITCPGSTLIGPAIRHRVAFVEDYDIALARTLYQGCDVWLNNPRRPQEACGTSGEKAALNGGLNCSVLDGWWDEYFDGENGWAISSVEGEADLAKRDAIEAASLFDLIEHQIVPLFYDRMGGPVPRRWVQRVKSSLRSLGPEVVASRMVRDYVEMLYEPVARRADVLAEDHDRARALAAWKARVLGAWDGVKVLFADAGDGANDLGAERPVVASVDLGGLGGDDVTVQLVHGSVGPTDEIEDPTVVSMSLESPDDDGGGPLRYVGRFTCERAGRYGFTVRVVPAHPDLSSPTELGRMAWA